MRMEEEVPDPLEICRNQQVILDAQQEVGKLDVLVCGECHDVFHYVEAFQEHRRNKTCEKTSILPENYKREEKAQVWAFMLWKCTEQKKVKSGETAPSPWAMYQRWCKLDVEKKDIWMIAGNVIQNFTKINMSKLEEIKTKGILGAFTNSKHSSSNKIDEDDVLEEGEIRLSQLTNAQRVAIKVQVDAKKNAKRDTDPLRDSDVDTEDEVENQIKSDDVGKKPSFKPVQIRTNTTYKKLDSRVGLRTTKNNTIEEANVDKIISRRFNYKKRYMEYLIKWENTNITENTWEPKSHLENCKWLVEEFDRLFNKPKSKQKIPRRVDESHSDHSENEELSMGRPQRSCKQKALDQVKVWCGDITEEEDGMGKRMSFSDGDSTDSFEKKMKFEEDSESSEEEKPAITIKRVVKNTNPVNGITNKPEASPQQPIVTKLSHKQLPSLTSGVYIMSKTDGIIKLGSGTSIANPLKVGSKIGQTHIKVVKKDIPKTPLRTMAKPTVPLHKALPPHIKKTVIGMPAIDKSDSKTDKFEEEESDGIEEMDFPTDLPLPSPDSPPGEFTLDPLTGKLVGQEYPEVKPEQALSDNASLDNLVKEAVADMVDIDVDTATSDIACIKQEVKIENESEPLNEIKPPLSVTANNSEEIQISVSLPDITTSVVSTILPNIVATTDVVNIPIQQVVKSDQTIKVESIPSVSTIVSSSKIPMKDDLEECIVSNTIERNNSIANISMLSKSKPAAKATSILNAALTSQTNVGPKKLLTPPTVRHKVTSINRSSMSRPSLSKPSTNSSIIHRVAPTRPRTVLPKTTIIHHEPVLKKQINTYRPASVARKIGSTSIYKTPNKPQLTTVRKVASAAISSHQTLVQTPSTSNVINMPLLTGDEEQPAASSTPVASLNEDMESLQTLSGTESGLSDLSSFNLPDTETPLLITGDDGTIYQVAGHNEEGQAILVSEGPDGQQQCVLLASNSVTEDAQPLLMDTSSAEPDELEQTLMINTQVEEPEGDASEESQIVAEIVKAEPPSPGGTRKVVLMLPDGNLMMTEVSAEQYAALELDK